MSRLSPLNAPVARINRSHEQTEEENWELKLSKVKIDSLAWCSKTSCDHKTCKSVNLLVPKEGWEWWKKRHYFCESCRRRES